jgi:redox-sensitive bicupin YhaK (pirin superfamily)
MLDIAGQPTGGTIGLMTLDIRRSGDRFRSDVDGRSTYHSFSFGSHYDPSNTGFGGLICHNDDRVAPGFGYPNHPHRDLEIVTWVLSGALTHRDASGESGVIAPGTVQAMSAGSGIVHSETVAADAGPTRFIQTWVRPNSPGGATTYSSADAALVPDELTTLASGVRPQALVRIGASASLYAVRLESSVNLPEAHQLHVFVATGSAELGGEVLGEGDAARLTDVGGLQVDGRAELLVWSFRESSRRG